MIERVYQQAQKTGISSICVATDDARIQKEVEGFGGQVVMTRDDHVSGTDRLAEVSEKQGWAKDDIVLNLQGDEPLMPPQVIQFLAALAGKSDAGIATLATPIHTQEDIFNPSIVKVVMNAEGKAHYFSRAPIPWGRDSFQWPPASKQQVARSGLYYRHLGMYAYRVKTLQEIPLLPSCAIEQTESLEQLRPLYHGIEIQVGIIEDAPHHGVDTKEDLQRVSALFAE